MEIEQKKDGLPLSALPPISLSEFMRQSGLSRTTLWRFQKRGWLKTLVISNRQYVSREEIGRFNERAQKGEFAKETQDPSKRKASK